MTRWASERSADEQLVVGAPLTIDMRYAGLFRDQRPGSIWRVELRQGSHHLIVRDESNGVLREFRKYPSTVGGFREVSTLLPRDKKTFAVLGEHHDALTFENRAHIQSCDLCGELDPVGARGRCGRCLDVAYVTQGGTRVDVDFARALVRHELAIEEHPSMCGVLEQLDGLAPWHLLSEPFVDADSCDNRLVVRAVLLEKIWRGTLGTHVVMGGPRGHRWTTERAGRNETRFQVEASVIRAEATGEVVAVRRA